MILLALGIAVAWVAHAQADSVTHATPHLRYSGSVFLGALFGKSGGDLSLGTTQGISYGRVALGVGIGHNYYKEWSMSPIVAHASVDLFTIRKDDGIVLMVNAGKVRSKYVGFNEELHATTSYGNSFGAALGYRHADGPIDLIFSLGYSVEKGASSYQHVIYYYDYAFPGQPSSSYTLQRTFNRISLTFGVGFH